MITDTTFSAQQAAGATEPAASRRVAPAEAAPAEIEISLLTGGYDKPYALGISTQLLSKHVRMDFIGGDEIDSPELHTSPKLNFLNLREGLKPNAGVAAKLSRTLGYYARLIRYAATSKPRIFHILWNNKFEFFDRTFLTLYYKLLGKKLVFTAHNVNAGTRDKKDSFLNQLGLRAQYRLVDHIFVHTEKMKAELLKHFGIAESKVTVIPFGINNSVANTDLTPAQAKSKLGIANDRKTILFFGSIQAYKGLEYLVDAFQQLAVKHPDYRLVIAGQPRGQEYFDAIRKTIAGDPARFQIIQKIEFVPDAETELYFKAADVVVLPYTHIFQSGVLFLGYSFGLPVIASDVGSMRDDIVEGETGLLCRPCDAAALAATIERYFEGELYATLDQRRAAIREHANRKYSWDIVGEKTRNVYLNLLEEKA